MAEPQIEDGDAAATEENKLPLHEDVMQLARLGEIGPIQKLFEEGKSSATFTDKEGITPLHWAAINNHYALSKFLIENGADVNAKGGEAVATPAMWAVQKCRTYIVHLLLQLGADPLLTDVQGYNMLHLAVFDGNAYLVLLLLHQNIPVDGPDPAGHTCLMWAAYKGYPACVELLLQWGASINAKDEKGFTALHWSLVNGNYFCVHKLLEAGADRFVETSDGKSPAVVAFEMKSRGSWYRALRDLGFNVDATTKQLPLPGMGFLTTRSFHNRFFFLLPFPVLFVIFLVMSRMIIYLAIPLSLFLAWITQWGSQQVLAWAPSDMKHLQRTPLLAGVFAGSIFWVGVQWITVVLPTTYANHFAINVLFAALYGLCTYFYALSMTEDPGYVPKLGSRSSQKAVIDELFSLWKFDEQSFCIHCMIRVPVRTKHCRRCSRCVAKHDHHCPWIHNCVGVNNQRHFLLYVINMAIGVLIYLRLVYFHLEEAPAPVEANCNIIPQRVCEYVLRDSFTVVVSTWAALQLIWVTMLLFTQFVLISRASTTWESMKGRTQHLTPAAEAVTAAVTAGTTSMDAAQISTDASQPAAQASKIKKYGYFGQWKRLLGLDSFIATASGKTSKRGNPFSRGVITNCRDFWCDPAPIFRSREGGSSMLDGAVINYNSMYENPPRMKYRSTHTGDGARYESVGNDDNV